MDVKTTALAAVKQEMRLQKWSAQIEAQQTRWLLEGLMIEQPKAIREGKPFALY